MHSIRRPRYFQYLVIGLALLFAGPVLADHLPDNKLASGKADTVLCGLDAESTPMKDILSKLGKPDHLDPWIEDKRNVSYQWSKGPLTIQVNTYQFGDYLNKPPLWIEVSGNDPDGVCKTGRGLKLGDSLADIRRLYGAQYGIRPIGKGKHMVTIEWSTEPSIQIDLAPDGRIVRINAAGMLE